MSTIKAMQSSQAKMSGVSPATPSRLERPQNVQLNPLPSGARPLDWTLGMACTISPEGRAVVPHEDPWLGRSQDLFVAVG